MNKLLKKAVSLVTAVGIMACSMPVFAAQNSETVYNKLNNEGESYKTIVTTKIGDDTEENEKEAELPIETKISYKLDGRDISAEEISGKSGRVEIRLEYVNKAENKVTINGREEKMYTPFLVMTGAIIENENNKNIEVKNGKVIDNGDKSIIVGISLPGIQDSLKTSSEILNGEIPSSVEISMDSKNFEMKNIVTYATPKVLDEQIEWGKLDSVFEQVNELQSGANSLENGTNQLKDGISELDNGAMKLNDGAAKLASGTDELYKTISAKIGDLRELEKKYTNKEDIVKEITKIINQKLEEIMPELKKEAKAEASRTVKRHKGELEKAVVETSLKYTNSAINEKLAEIEKRGGIITEEDAVKLEAAFKEIIKKELVSIYSNSDYSAFISELKKDVKETAIEMVNEAIDEQLEEQTKAAMKNPAQYAGLIQEIKAQVYESTGVEISNEQALKMIGTVSNSSMNSVKLGIDEKIKNASVRDLSSIETMVKREVEGYINGVVSKLTATFGEENLELIKNTMTKTVIEDIKTEITNNAAIQGYEGKIKQELSNTVDKVANATAEELAERYTETLATEIANNVLENQLSEEISETVVGKEIKKYEDMIEEKLNTLNTAADTLENALSQINNGANQLKAGTTELAKGTKKLLNGAETLNKGMNEFNRKGISRIYDMVNGDLYNLKVRGMRLEELAKEYKIEGSSDKVENVKFISIVDAIKEKGTVEKEDKKKKE